MRTKDENVVFFQDLTAKIGKDLVYKNKYNPEYGERLLKKAGIDVPTRLFKIRDNEYMAFPVSSGEPVKIKGN